MRYEPVVDPSQDGVMTAGRVVAIVLSVLFGLPFLAGVWVVLSSTVLAHPESDQHGYGLIFGTLLAVVAGLLTLAALPFALRGTARKVVGAIGIVAVLVALGFVGYAAYTVLTGS
ncbi:hypothetical protein OCAE111667_01800 [Occultella aeris]|uniref:Major facilitator superfamily (MFS) profile domain-containing protein n=1 Tax=Occultella aeris TaxID=2761496 RepID=A0A7M4DGX1_9MICO|nr:hypothetical protein [Occultella aeris]VZO36164.1 hypothetical protein HALOF300_01368 [Occultella aeris]